MKKKKIFKIVLIVLLGLVGLAVLVTGFSRYAARSCGIPPRKTCQ